MKTTNRHWVTCGCAMWSAALLFSLVAVSNGAEETKEERHLSWRETPASLALLNGDNVVWQFNHLRDGKEKGCPYFHPLATMEGSVLTDLRPLDHPHHRGLRFAWKKINGLEGYWSWPEAQKLSPDKEMGHSGVGVTAVRVAANDDFSARFELEMSYHPPGEPAALTEKRIIEAAPQPKSGRASCASALGHIDRMHFAALKARPLCAGLVGCSPWCSPLRGSRPSW